MTKLALLCRQPPGFLRSLLRGLLRGSDGAQVAIEYLLLIALGLLVIIVGTAIAIQLKSLSDMIAARAAAERNASLAMLIS